MVFEAVSDNLYYIADQAAMANRSRLAVSKVVLVLYNKMLVLYALLCSYQKLHLQIYLSHADQLTFITSLFMLFLTLLLSLPVRGLYSVPWSLIGPLIIIFLYGPCMTICACFLCLQ